MKYKTAKYLKSQVKARYFDEYGSCGYDWRKGFEYSNANEYVDDIKSVAQYYGYDSDEIDCLLNNGFTPEEVEEMLYADDFLEV